MATYYVDSDDGSESYDGTAPTYESGVIGPWLSLQFKNMSGGDTVYLKRGTTACYKPIIYAGYGTSGSGYITIKSDVSYSTGDGHKPMIGPGGLTVPYTSWGSPDGNGVYTKNVGTVTITAFIEDWHNLKLATGSTCSDGHYYYSDPNLYYKPSSGLATEHEIRTCTGVYSGTNSGGAGDGAYTVWDGLHFIVKGINVTPGAGGNNVTVQNCDFSDIGSDNALTVYTGGSPNSSNITVNNCTFTYCTNNIYFSAWPITSYFDNVIVSNCVMNYTHQYRYGGYTYNLALDNDGISVQNARNSIFEHNEINGGICNIDSGIHIWTQTDVVCTGNIIRYNYIHDAAYGHGINIDGEVQSNTTNVQIYGNIIANCGNSSGDARAGIHISKPHTTSPHSLIANNTIYNCPSGVILLAGNPAGADYCDFKNNIINNCPYNIYVTSTDISHCTIDYNAYYPVSGNCFYVNGDQTWATWSASHDANSVTTDPQFVNAGGSFALATDFQLDLSSPCINAGTDVGLTADYGGNPIPV